MILIYLMIGVAWTWWLEWFTTTTLEGKYGQPWEVKERLFHSLLWPYSLGTFVYAAVKEFNKRNKGNE